MAEYRVGACTVDITPSQEALKTGNLWLGGFVLRLTAGDSVAHPLSARAIVIEDSAQNRMALVTLDVLGIQQDFTDRIRARVQPLGLDPGSVLVNSVHTHTAPITRPFPVIDPAGHADPDPSFMQAVENGAVQAIVTAFGQLATTDADLFFGRGKTDIGMNRLPKPGPYDPTLDVLVAKHAGTDQVLAVVFFHGCHPVTLGGVTSVSPDFPGEARDQVEKVNPGAVAMFVQGFAGTVNPSGNLPVDVGTKLASDVRVVMTANMVKLSGPMQIKSASVSLPLAAPPGADYLANCIAHPNGGTAPERDAQVRWATMTFAALNDPATLTTSIPTELASVKIGRGDNAWRLVASGNEVVNEWSAVVRQIWNEPNITLAGYTGSVNCYLPNSDIINATPGLPLPQWFNYEGNSSFMYYGLPSPMDPAVDSVYLAALKALDPPVSAIDPASILDRIFGPGGASG